MRSDLESDGYAYEYSDRDQHRNSQRYCCSDSYRNRGSNADRNIYRNRHHNRHANGHDYAHGNFDCYGYGNSNGNGDSNGNENAHTDCHKYPSSNSVFTSTDRREQPVTGHERIRQPHKLDVRPGW